MILLILLSFFKSLIVIVKLNIFFDSNQYSIVLPCTANYNLVWCHTKSASGAFMAALTVGIILLTFYRRIKIWWRSRTTATPAALVPVAVEESQFPTYPPVPGPGGKQDICKAP